MVVLPKEVAQQVLKALTLGGAMCPNGGTARDQIDVAMSALRQAIAAKQQATDAIVCGAPHHGIDQSEVYDPKTGIYRWIDDGTRMRPGEQCSGRTRQTAGESTAPEYSHAIKTFIRHQKEAATIAHGQDAVMWRQP